MEKILSLDAIRIQFPDEWVLLGNPDIKDYEVLAGTVVHHHKDKRKILELAQVVIDKFEMIKIIFTGNVPKISRLGIFKVTED